MIFRDELEELARERGIDLVFVVGDHATDDGARLLSPEHLQELVPDIAERQVYVCGPPAMTEVLDRNVGAPTCLRVSSTPRSSPFRERNQCASPSSFSSPSPRSRSRSSMRPRRLRADDEEDRRHQTLRRLRRLRGQMGQLQVTIVVRKTTTITGTKKKVTRRMTAVSVPTYPDHTDRSVFINQNALPILRQKRCEHRARASTWSRAPPTRATDSRSRSRRRS